jgi:putative ABC transport system ATP-binding protein
MSTVLSAHNVNMIYPSGDRQLTVLSDIHFDIASGDVVAITGPSGSGKTTLLGLCAGLDSPTSGEISLMGKALSTMDEDERAILRNQHVGFIFQNFQLMPGLTALENVMLPMEISGHFNVKKQAKEWLDRVGLGDRIDHYPVQLSGGEQQRVALARAFVNNPKVLFADEPTGNLDGETGAIIEELMFSLNEHSGTSLIIVTHDMELADRAKRVISLKSGKIVSDMRNTVHQKETSIENPQV